ncbi:MAG: UDP-N-acetylmuramoyl-tripeptide--D-alanyl-D-alanine ligase [Victivallales bacterium]|nr:UDP-N-acetylmuramoyl-tripeptide--D-alanyl-D-alanine ligase [Victivallales bacterium]
MKKDSFTWFEIEYVTRGQWLWMPEVMSEDGDMEAVPYCSDIVDDSRKIVKGCLFVAIVGELTDGHKYIYQAADMGAGAVCVSKLPWEEDMNYLRARGCGCVLVADGLKAFQALACANRAKYDIPVLAVTGSCGKTSTKEMCAAVLEAHWPGQVVKTLGNTNNHFGVPRNLLRIDDTTRAAVIEAGTNHPGEIATLASMIHPTSALVCSIGAAHLEFFHDFDGVAEEKGDLLAAASSEGVAILPYQCPGKDVLLRHAAGHKILTFGLDDGADVQAVYGGQEGDKFRLELKRRDTGESVSFLWSIGGSVQAGNAAAAAAAGISLGLTLEEIAQGLQNCSLPGARMAQSDVDGIHWVNDAYNANPTSMKASLQWFDEISRTAPARVILIGDMLELGENSPQMHRETLEFARKLFPHDEVVTVGPRFGEFAASLGVRNFATAADVFPALQLPPGAWVYLKASMSMGLFKLVSGSNDAH